jgi:hypothetical protein
MITGQSPRAGSVTSMSVDVWPPFNVTHLVAADGSRSVPQVSAASRKPEFTVLSTPSRQPHRARTSPGSRSSYLRSASSSPSGVTPGRKPSRLPPQSDRASADQRFNASHLVSENQDSQAFEQARICPSQGSRCRARVPGNGSGRERLFLLRVRELRLFSRRRPFALATCMPSRVRARIRSDSNSATMASTFHLLQRRHVPQRRPSTSHSRPS